MSLCFHYPQATRNQQLPTNTATWFIPAGVTNTSRMPRFSAFGQVSDITSADGKLALLLLGCVWERTTQSPLSTAPSLEVAGYFTNGGATAQNLNDHERDLEIDHEIQWTRGKHSIKVGAQSLGFFVHNYDPDTFNGAYVFGGGSAPALDQNNTPQQAR
jgi:hypothetical protein